MRGEDQRAAASIDRALDDDSPRSRVPVNPRGPDPWNQSKRVRHGLFEKTPGGGVGPNRARLKGVSLG
jgi:hypothetical protein